MQQKLPTPAIVAIALTIVVIVGFFGYKAFFSNSSGGGEGKAIVIQVDKNDPKFQPRLPAGMSGGQ